MGVTLTNEMIQGAKETEKKYGIPSSITLGQILLESGGNYEGGLSKLAHDYHNLFGIKATSSNLYSIGSVTMNNKMGNDLGRYATFSSDTNSILEHGRILSLERYTSKLTNGSYSDWANALQLGGYATDNNYSSKLIQVIESHNLNQYDGDNTRVGDSTSILSNISVLVIIVVMVLCGVLFFIKSFHVTPDINKLKKVVDK